MEPEWQALTLGEVLELKRGYDLPKRKRIPGEIPLISSAGPSDFHDEAKVKAPGVVTGRYGTIGEVFYSDNDFWPLNTTLYVRDFKGNDEKFVYYFLKTIDYLQYSDKAAVPGVNRNHLHLAEVIFPTDRREQKAIAHILGSLDDKIELNRQINTTLESMAQTLFKSWFVDFDPVLDNALTAGNPIPDALAERAAARKALGDARKPLPEDIQQLFPEAFVWTEEMGWIPEGWEAAKLPELLEVKYGKDHKKLDEGNIPVYGSGGLMRHVNQSLYTGESILIPRKGTLSNLMYVNEEFWSVDTMFFSIPKKQHSAKYLFYTLKVFDFAGMNVGSAVPSMTTKVLNDLDVIKPPERVLKSFDRYMSDIFAKKQNLDQASTTLAKLRDTLLPKLLSGELRIPEAEKLAEEAQ